MNLESASAKFKKDTLAVMEDEDATTGIQEELTFASYDRNIIFEETILQDCWSHTDSSGCKSSGRHVEILPPHFCSSSRLSPQQKIGLMKPSSSDGDSFHIHHIPRHHFTQL